MKLSKKIILCSSIALLSIGSITGATIGIINNVNKKVNVKDNSVNSILSRNARKITNEKSIMDSDWYDHEFVKYDEIAKNLNININSSSYQTVNVGAIRGCKGHNEKLSFSINQNQLIQNKTHLTNKEAFFKKIGFGNNELQNISSFALNYLTNVDYLVYQNHRAQTSGSSHGSGPSSSPTPHSFTLETRQAKLFNKNFNILNGYQKPNKTYSFKSNVSIELNKPINSLFLEPESKQEFNINKILKVDEKTTFRGFRSNNLGFTANDEYLKTLFVMSLGVAKANELIKNSNIEQRNNRNFLAVIEALVNGKIVDISNSILKTLGISHDDVGGIDNTFASWWNKYENGIDITNDLNNLGYTKYATYAATKELKIDDPYLAYKLSNLFLNKIGNTNEYFAGLEYKITGIYSNGSEFDKNVQVKFNDISKKFELYTNENIGGINRLVRGFRISNQEMPSDDKNMFTIKNVKLINTTDAGNFSSVTETPNIGFMSLAQKTDSNNNKYIEEIFAQPTINGNDTNAHSIGIDFDIRKLIYFKKEWTKKEWEAIAERPITKEEEENPSLLLNDKTFKNNLFLMNENNREIDGVQPVEILDNDLKEYLLKDGNNNLLENNNAKKVLNNLDINAYNSINGIGINANFKNIERNGTIINKDDIGKVKTTRTQVKFTIGEKIQNNILTNTTKDINFDRSKTIEENILNNLINYDDVKNQNSLIKTNLQKVDWKENGFDTTKSYAPNNINITEGELYYFDQSDVNDFLNGTNNRIAKMMKYKIDIGNGTISFSQNSTNWGLILGITLPSVAFGILGLSLFIKSRKNTNKIIDDEEDDE